MLQTGAIQVSHLIMDMYLQDEYFSCRFVDVELGLLRLFRVDSLSGQKIHDVVLAVLVTVGGSYLVKLKKKFLDICKRYLTSMRQTKKL